MNDNATALALVDAKLHADAKAVLAYMRSLKQTLATLADIVAKLKTPPDNDQRFPMIW
ncbi:hypothetical protein N7E02_07110 (plasmid) [Aliirhizobium terrae]|uniref:hypothetical protein n=1 Tax=Terrirhizobium terrae TaxID=2926709 RepID=UPI002574FDCC|nr:hypothetical protein [Rhizobium sp. CC-CFT758]WJH38399.1 hypothetical protein N7E02_07110 [Rhizobium sp. CC-CFT758]